MIEQTVAKWHDVVAGKGDLDALLADDVVFVSPIVFTPQKGKDLAKLYLGAAGATIGGDEKQGGGGRKFRYVKQVLDHPHAVLEFETEMEGKYVNGVDILTCDDDDRIVEFRVMIRPLQAIQLVHRQMAAMIEQMKGGG
jgi:hypothetical protein